MASNVKIYISNDTLIEVTGLQNASSEAYLNAATVTATIKDSNGDEVAGESWPKTLSYVAASDGNYRGTVDAALSISNQLTYFVEITAAESGVDGFWRIPVQAVYRES